VHIFRVGNDDLGRQAESDLIQIARRSGGEYLTTATAADLTAQIQSAMAVRASRKEQVARMATPAATTTTTTTSDIAPSTVSSIATTVPNEPKEELKLTKLQGSVSYYGIPAKRAKIVLEGESSQVVLRTDAQGNFSIDDVEPGMYTLWTEAIVKNTFRNAARKLKVDNTGRTKTIDLILD
jgi:hypothetical protein